MIVPTIIRIHLVAIVISLAVSFAAWQAFLMVIESLNSSYLAQRRLQVSEQISEFRLQLEQHLNTTFYLTRGFATLIDLGMLREPDFKKLWSDNFQPWAAKTHEQMPFIRNIGFVEKYTITHAYPPDSNAAVLGVDYRNVPTQWPRVKETVDSQQPLMAGPIELIQGGTGVVFRTPFYSDNDNGSSEYVGMALIVLDLPALLEAAGINAVADSLNIALRADAPMPGKTFWGQAGLFQQPERIAQPILFKGGQWSVAAEPVGGWPAVSPQARALSFLFIILTAFIATAVFLAVVSIQSLLAHTRTLESRVKQRTRLLQQAKEQAENANHIQSTFFASITHDLRTPLNSIIGLSQLVMDMELGDKQREYIRKSLTSANLLLVLINDILSYSKIESGKEKLHISAFDVHRLLHKVDDLFAVAARAKALKLTFDTQTDLPRVWLGDEDKLLQILANLCANALKFTDQGGITVKTWHSNDSGRDMLCFSVSDSGIGIEEKDLAMLFEPFIQASHEQSSRPMTTGTGLGLSICKRLTEMMGGTIDVDSTPGRGSTFSVCLPLAITDSSALPSHNETGHEAPHRLAGRKLLLAEDNGFNQYLAIRLLEKAGITVIVAENGQQVLELLQKHTVDGILMDIQMPVMDGLKATHEIRRNSDYRDLPIIAMTANAGEDDHQAALGAGMNDFISKPIDIATLYRVLDRWL